MIHKFSVRTSGATEPDVERLGVTLGLPDLTRWRDYYIEFERELSDDVRQELCAALSDTVGTHVEVDQPLASDAVMVAHRRGVMDNESDSIVALCALLGIGARAGKATTSYQSSSPQLPKIIAATQFNSAIEDFFQTEPHYETLLPVSNYLPVEQYDLLALADDALAALGKARGRNLSLAQMQHIRGIQESLELPAVTDVFLEAMDARWSDHCAHTTWKSLGNLLSRLIAASQATKNPNIVSMFHDNAGVWDFYDGYAIAIKAETHNGPSAISAYFGQLTKLGGVLRDILGTGLVADPIGSFEYTATGLPEDPSPIAGRPAPRQIAHDTIQAIKEYGNTFGVPMMHSHMTFHPRYRAKPFALGGSIGLLPSSAAQQGRPEPGDLVVLIGGLTGGEGLHGASTSSAGSTMDEIAVQIGAPLEQVKFRKALTDLRDADCLRAITDIGGAGLNSAVGEIGEACGVWINTALVPLKTSALPMWRILLSESQERMLLAISPAQEAKTRRILNRHQVRTTVIGRFTDTGRYCVFHQPTLDEQAVIALDPVALPEELGELGFDVPYQLLDAPVSAHNVGELPVTELASRVWPELDISAVAKVLERVVFDVEVASQWYADAQYDSTVQGNTVYGPHYGKHAPVASGYWAGTPVEGNSAAAVLSTAFNPWLFEIDPVRAVRQLFCSVIAGQVLAGVELLDICLCDNFYTPHLADHWREWLVAMVDELAELVRFFGTPIISGKDSSAGSVRTDEGLVNVPPAVFLTALGKVPDHRLLLGEEWTGAGNLLVRIGPSTAAPAGTVAARALNMTDTGLDDVSLDEMKSYLATLADSRRFFLSATRLDSGGVAAQLIKGTLASGLGVELDSAIASAADLFAEHRLGALVEIVEQDFLSLPAELRPTRIGRLVSREGVRLGNTDLLTPAIAESWATSFAGRLG